MLYVRWPPLCRPASQSASAGIFSADFFGLAGAFLDVALDAKAGRVGSAASRARRNAFSRAMLSSTALAAASRSRLLLLSPSPGLLISARECDIGCRDVRHRLDAFGILGELSIQPNFLQLGGAFRFVLHQGALN
jgi:hypothetical protein